MSKISTVFFGTPEFAASALAALLSDPRFEVVGVVTQPDRPAGRKKIMTPPPVASLAKDKGIRLFQPEKLKDVSLQDEILSTKPDLAVVVAYGNLIPKRLLEAVPRGFVNIHPSLLPKHRGAAPITATILGGDAEAGICLMVLDEQMDHGPIIACRRITLDGTETTAALRAKLAPIAGEMLKTELIDFLDGKIVPRPQEHDSATFCRQLSSADAKIDWSKPAEEIGRLIRAMHGVTPAWTTLDGQMLLIHRASVLEAKPPKLEVSPPSTIVVLEKKISVACGDGHVILEEIQLAGGKPMSGEAFLNGHRGLIGKKLGK
jgi:methionyl-tRNA formyltransferase